MKPENQSPKSHPGSRAAVELAFREAVKEIPCPECGLKFTDYAVDWGDAWSEGRRDYMDEIRPNEERGRDGPYKLKCELCGTRSWLNYFAFTVRKVQDE